jgi:hypothetical protein
MICVTVGCESIDFSLSPFNHFRINWRNTSKSPWAHIKKEVNLALYDINETNKSIRKALKIAKIIVPGHGMPFAVENGVPKRLPNFRANDFKISLYGELSISLLQFCCVSQLSF